MTPGVRIKGFWELDPIKIGLDFKVARNGKSQRTGVIHDPERTKS